MPNKAFKPLAMLARMPSTPRHFAHGYAIVAQTALHTWRQLNWALAARNERTASTELPRFGLNRRRL